MPSSWSSRLLPNTSPSAQSPSPRTPSNTNKPLPRPPDELLNPPTLHHERLSPSSSKPRPIARKEHARSSSNPLPKLFGRKKSSTNLREGDIDISADDDGTDGGLAEQKATVPARVISGKKSKVDGDGKISRRCMCCDSKVKVPKDLWKFRCLCCLTINDLKPVEEQSDEEKDRSQDAQKGALRRDDGPSSAYAPISIERTRTIIDRCVATYLQARSQRPVTQTETSREADANHNVAPTTRPPVVRTVSRDQVPSTDLNSKVMRPLARSRSPDSSRGTSPLAEPFQTPRGTNPPSDTRASRPLLNVAGNSTVDAGGPPVSSLAAPARKPLPTPINIGDRRGSAPSSSETKLARSHGTSPKPMPSPQVSNHDSGRSRRHELARTVFRPLETYLSTVFNSSQSLNCSFSTARPNVSGRARSESNIQSPPPELMTGVPSSSSNVLSELDAKTLLLGDIGENGSWWTGRIDRTTSSAAPMHRKYNSERASRPVSSKTPNINWHDVGRWYELIHNAGRGWRHMRESSKFSDEQLASSRLDGHENAFEIDSELSEARDHAMRVLLKCTENLLKRPTRPLDQPEDIRFLLIILQNPSLYPQTHTHQRTKSGLIRPSQRAASQAQQKDDLKPSVPFPKKQSSRDVSRHTGLLKRIFGLLAHSSDTCQRHLISWFSRLEDKHLVRYIDLVAAFVTYRISRKSGPASNRDAFQDGGLIPDLSGSAVNTSAQLHSALGLSGSGKSRSSQLDIEPEWSDDWQAKAGAKVMSILFAANNIWHGQSHAQTNELQISTTMPGTAGRVRRSGQLLHTSSFYNTLLDYQDLIADFKVWETKRDKFSFCQYPLFLSMGAKIKILEHDARRQMENKAREAYFDNVIRQRAIDGHFHMRVRRECMLEDSFQQISQAVGSGQEELKKGLRVHFAGEEGVDAGGLRKEWFLLLVRDIFNPQHGMFVYDEESGACYFNPHSFETSDQYYLVGALLGLAIYNSTILDVALPPFAFRKLLASAPGTASTSANMTSLTGTKGQMTYTIADLAELHPSLAAGLQQLLDFEGDVQATYCRDFVASSEAYGVIKEIPLVPNGNNIPVTNSNRQEYVDAYVRYLLDTAVARQFEPFKRGFFTVCAGNTLSLFRAEEIELLICGSDEPLQVDSLRAVAVYENWRATDPPHALIASPADEVDIVRWFWESLAEASPAMQRKLLTFVTGTDRIPAVGSTSLVLRIVAGGDGWGGGSEAEKSRFPIARTCFNVLTLWRYDSRAQLEERLWRAVEESEGFGLK